MTNQEAIGFLEDIPTDGLTMNEIDAIDVAIKALEKLAKGKASIESYAAKVWEDLLTDD